MRKCMSDILTNLQRVKKIYELMLKRVTKVYGMTKNEIDVLLFLANNKSYDTAKEIVELRSLSKSHVCKSIDSLSKRGFLLEEKDKRDRRCVHLKLDSSAFPIIKEAQAVQKEFVDLLYSGVTIEERTTMEKIFEKISANIDGVLRDDI